MFFLFQSQAISITHFQDGKLSFIKIQTRTLLYSRFIALIVLQVTRGPSQFSAAKFGESEYKLIHRRYRRFLYEIYAVYVFC